MISYGYMMVAPAGLEPARPFGLTILSRVRLPFRHGATVKKRKWRDNRIIRL